ncbi:MAG: hypothetical protein SGILL_005398 [Bacillariaceae sp.]
MHNRSSSSDGSGLDFVKPSRICNSDDDISSGNCIPQDTGSFDFAYPEIRIHNGNWESSIFLSWIMQIMLMEVLQVPTTVGLTTKTTKNSSFYALDNTLEYSAEAYPFDALKNGVDCQTKEEPCIQVMPEVWNGQQHEWSRALQAGFMEPVEGNGAVGKGSWFTPMFAAERDSTLVSVYGLKGEKNRHKLAENFKRPTTWLEYCSEVSPTKCDDDPVAAFYPSTPEQEQTYFHAQFFPGYFRLLPENDCVLNPTNCTGYIIGPPCTWSTNVDAQLYWNDIRLTPDGPVQPNGGYEYRNMVEIWRAANATKEAVMMWWWKPDTLVEEFFDSDASMQQILLPDATEACSRNRVDTEARCSEDIAVRRGDPQGACDQEFHALQKAVSTGFQQQAAAESLETKSPGYDFIKQLRVTDLELNGMLRNWVNKKVDPYGHDAREAVCEWVVENYDSLLGFIPPGYPKQIETTESHDAPYMTGAFAVGLVTCLAVMLVAAACYKYRNRRVLVYAQTHIMALIMVGFLFIAVGSILLTVEPTSGVCMAQVWMVNVGYSTNLIPLLVKIAAINKVVASAKKLRRVKITKQKLFGIMAGLLTLVIIYLIVWSAVDPVGVVQERTVTNTTSTVVEECITCSSKYSFWGYLALAWQAILLLMAAVLAFQSRNAIPEFNESNSLGTMIYSRCLFVALRGILVLFQKRGILDPGVSAAVMSYILSLDTVTAMGIYVAPKILKAYSSSDSDYSSSSSQRGQSVGGIHSSRTVGQIKARASLRVAFSEQEPESSMSFRQNRFLSLRSRADDSTDPLTSSSQIQSSSSGHVSGSSSRVFDDSWQTSQKRLSEIRETSRDGKSSTEMKGSETEQRPIPPESAFISEERLEPSKRLSFTLKDLVASTKDAVVSDDRKGKDGGELKTTSRPGVIDNNEAQPSSQHPTPISSSSSTRSLPDDTENSSPKEWSDEDCEEQGKTK